MGEADRTKAGSIRGPSGPSTPRKPPIALEVFEASLVSSRLGSVLYNLIS